MRIKGYNTIVFTVAIKPEANEDSQEEDVKPSKDALLGNESEQMLIQALDGFLLVLSEEGDITYASENITELLGLQQIDILSQPIWDYAHQVSERKWSYKILLIINLSYNR